MFVLLRSAALARRKIVQGITKRPKTERMNMGNRELISSEAAMSENCLSTEQEKL